MKHLLLGFLMITAFPLSLWGQPAPAPAKSRHALSPDGTPGENEKFRITDPFEAGKKMVGLLRKRCRIIVAEEHECRVCHNRANSPNFRYDLYVQKIVHPK